MHWFTVQRVKSNGQKKDFKSRDYIDGMTVSFSGVNSHKFVNLMTLFKKYTYCLIILEFTIEPSLYKCLFNNHTGYALQSQKRHLGTSGQFNP